MLGIKAWLLLNQGCHYVNIPLCSSYQQWGAKLMVTIASRLAEEETPLKAQAAASLFVLNKTVQVYLRHHPFSILKDGKLQVTFPQQVHLQHLNHKE